MAPGKLKFLIQTGELHKDGWNGNFISTAFDRRCLIGMFNGSKYKFLFLHLLHVFFFF